MKKIKNILLTLLLIIGVTQTTLAQTENIDDLRQSALNKVREGITTIDEVERVTKD